MRNAVGSRATGESFHSFFKLSQTFMSVSITQQKCRERVFYFSQKIPQCKKENQLVYFVHQNVNSLCLCHHYVNSFCQFCVSIELQKHSFMPISESICYWLFSKMIQESPQPKKTSVILQLYKTPHVLIHNNYCKNNFGSQSCMQPPVLTKAQLMHSKNNVPSSPKYTKKTSTVH